MSLFAALEAAPDLTASDKTPEKPHKKADTRRQISAHFGPVNHPLKHGQQPGTHCIIMGLSRQEQEKLKNSEIKTYGQNGQDFCEPWKFRTFASDSKFMGVKWQDGIGTDRAPDLKLCKGSGAMIKPCINEVYAKKAAEDAIDMLGHKLNWVVSNYRSKKNDVTMLVIDNKPLFYGNPTYVLNQMFNDMWPTVEFKREQVRSTLSFASMPRPQTQRHMPAGRSVKRIFWLGSQSQSARAV